MTRLILPGDPLYELTLATAIPPGWRQTAEHCNSQVAFVAAPGSGLLRPATPGDLMDYLEGGEYAERCQETGDVEAGP